MYHFIASIGDIFAYFKQMRELDNMDIEVARTNIARNAHGFSAKTLALERVSPILREIK